MGNIVLAIALLFFGPVPFIKIAPNTSIIQGMAAVSGLGYSLVMISTFSRAQFGALAKGFEENTETYQAISGKKI